MPLLVTFCDPTAETGVSFWTHEQNRMDEQRDVTVEIVFRYFFDELMNLKVIYIFSIFSPGDVFPLVYKHK